jgi:hypothetical protein
MARRRAANSGESSRNSQLLVTKSNDELLTRWLTDHPGEKEVPPNVKKHMGNVKSILRHKGRKDGTIFIFGRVGGDNAYGSVDQSVVMDSLKLVE